MVSRSRTTPAVRAFRSHHRRPDAVSGGDAGGEGRTWSAGSRRCADAPLIEARVCQYEQSADGNLIVDTHPDAGNAWIAGGGSGHGYKLGASLGEMLADQALGQREKEPFFSLSRLLSQPAG